MGASGTRKIYVFIVERKGEARADCPQLNLFATEKDADSAVETIRELCLAHIEFANRNGLSWEDISTPVPAAFEQLFEAVLTNERERKKRPSRIFDNFELDPLTLSASASPA